jgi:hypothetical protein
MPHGGLIDVPIACSDSHLTCNDLDASEAFYNRLGFTRPDSEKPAAGESDTYRMLSDGKAATCI